MGLFNKDKVKKKLKGAGRAYLEMSNHWAKTTGQDKMIKPMLPKNTNHSFANNPFNPLYNPGNMLAKKANEHAIIPKTKYFDGTRYSLDAVRGTKEEALARAADQRKSFWKHARVVKCGNDWAVYVHGHKRR